MAIEIVPDILPAQTEPRPISGALYRCFDADSSGEPESHHIPLLLGYDCDLNPIQRFHYIRDIDNVMSGHLLMHPPDPDAHADGWAHRPDRKLCQGEPQRGSEW